MANDTSDKLPTPTIGPPVKGENNIASPMPFGLGHDKLYWRTDGGGRELV